jgi:hypothetical protein
MSSSPKTSFCKTDADCVSKKCGPSGLCLCTQDPDCGNYGNCNVPQGVCIPNLCQLDSDCSDHGTCSSLYGNQWQGGLCICKDGWSHSKGLGNPCVVPPKESCKTDKDCGNYGIYGKCQAGFCNCALSDDTSKTWGLTLGGTNCQTQCKTADDCGFGGSCDQETQICKCREGWSGLQCHVPPTNNKCTSIQDCNWQEYVGGGDIYQGECNMKTNQCSCTGLWDGNRCQTFSDSDSSNSEDELKQWMKTIGQLVLMGAFPKSYMLGSLFMGDYSTAAGILIYEIPSILKDISKGMETLIEELVASGISDMIERQIMSMIASEFMARMGSSLGLESARFLIKVITSVTDEVFDVLDPFLIIGMVLDMLDVGGYNAEMNNEILQIFREQMYKSIASSPGAIKAMITYPFEVYVTQMQTYHQAFANRYKEKFQDYVEEYLTALKVNSDGLPILYSGYTPPIDKKALFKKILLTAIAVGFFIIAALLTFVNVFVYKKYAAAAASTSKGRFYAIFFTSLVGFFGGLGVALYFTLKPDEKTNPKIMEKNPVRLGLSQTAPAETFPLSLISPGPYTLQNNLGNYLTATESGLKFATTPGVFVYTPEQTLMVPGGLFWNPTGGTTPLSKVSAVPIQVDLTQTGYVFFPTLVTGGAFAGYVGDGLTWKTSQWKIRPTSSETPSGFLLSKIPQVGTGSSSFPHTRYRQGYGPTAVDLLNAMRYARGKVLKIYCLEDTNNYEYIPTEAVGYVCPDGLACSEGTCKFTETGCANNSYLNYWECKREQKICTNECDQTQPGVPKECKPGLSKSSKCRVDKDCSDTKFPMCDSDLKTCVNKAGNTPRQENKLDSIFLQWDDKKKVCNADVSVFKKWCELTETRKGYRVCSGKKDLSCMVDDDCKQSDHTTTDTGTGTGTGTGTEIKDYGPCVKNPHGIIRPPNLFYNYGKDNKCYTTKPYCAAFETSFGKSKNYVVVEACDTSDKAVDTNADCCVKLGQSVAEFFFGRTLTRGVLSGSAGRFLASTLGLASMCAATGCIALAEGRQFVDHRLVKKEKLVKSQAIKGMDASLFSWNDKALKEFGLAGMFIGFSEEDLKKTFPDLLETSPESYVFLDLNKTTPAGDKHRVMLDFFTRNSKDVLETIFGKEP